MMWSGRDPPQLPVMVKDERDGGHPVSEVIEMEAFRVRVRGLRFNDARAKTVLISKK